MIFNSWQIEPLLAFLSFFIILWILSLFSSLVISSLSFTFCFSSSFSFFCDVVPNSLIFSFFSLSSSLRFLVLVSIINSSLLFILGMLVSLLFIFLSLFSSSLFPFFSSFLSLLFFSIICFSFLLIEFCSGFSPSSIDISDSLFFLIVFYFLRLVFLLF